MPLIMMENIRSENIERTIWGNFLRRANELYNIPLYKPADHIRATELGAELIRDFLEKEEMYKNNIKVLKGE